MTSPFIKLVNERAKYGPIPPPEILTEDEVGNADDLLSTPAYVLLRRKAPYTLPVGDSSIYIPFFNIPFLMNDLINRNIPVINNWIIAYLLENSVVDTKHGLIYLSIIVKNDVVYPTKVTNLIERNKYVPMYDIYWKRFLRPEKLRLAPYISKFNLIDIYLVPGNIFERYAIRKLLSYYNNNELLKIFDSFINKIEEPFNIDMLAAVILSRFGYFVLNQQDLIYYDPNQTKWIISLNELIISKPNTVTYERWNMALLRLYIHIMADWPYIENKDSWQPFIDFTLNRWNYFYQLYKFTKENIPELSIKNWTITGSLEQIYSLCLLCEIDKSQDRFGMCGHGVCMDCQVKLKNAKCPFCTEHFVAKALDNNFIDNIQDGLPDTNLQTKILTINKIKHERKYRFDWSNSDIQLIEI